MSYFEKLPAIAKAAGEAYASVDKIVMFGSDSSQLTGNIINTVTQISEGLGESLGIDLKSLANSMTKTSTTIDDKSSELPDFNEV